GGTIYLQPGQAGIWHDGGQPGVGVPPPPFEETVGAQHCFLHPVLRGVGGARDPAREVIPRIPVPKDHPLRSVPGVAQGPSIIAPQATTRIVPVMSSWKSPQKWSQANPNTPILSGVNDRRVKPPGTMSVRSLKSGRLKPITTSALVNSSTTGSPFFSSI